MNRLATIEHTYQIAKELYAENGVDTDAALDKLNRIAISLHCWQTDDVVGLESPEAQLTGGGIQVTGNYPGKARNIDEIRMDLKKVVSLLPGTFRLNLHAIYGEFGGKRVDRDAVVPEHFQGWIDWARQNDFKLDFNASCFSHPKSNDGFTLSSKNDAYRRFWIEHVKHCREISAVMGRQQNSPCVHNLWIPDGSKDNTVDRWTHRSLLKESLDDIFETRYMPTEMKDSLESKLFGIGSESFVVGSFDFYLGYAMSRGHMMCLDMGHFHPTESIGDKISSIMQFSDEMLFHVSRGVRWDSDHVPTLSDELRCVAEEIVRADVLHRVNFATDFFDGSINRIGAYVTGVRSLLKALLIALLEPRAALLTAENNQNHFVRLALLEEAKALPFGAVWDFYCLKKDVAPGNTWINDVLQYENEVLSKRS
ncbi:MAG: L-rhamnose isomerase [Candidatus Zhuqueibacterota bacterium]